MPENNIFRFLAFLEGFNTHFYYFQWLQIAGMAASQAYDICDWRKTAVGIKPPFKGSRKKQAAMEQINKSKHRIGTKLGSSELFAEHYVCFFATEKVMQMKFFFGQEIFWS